MLLATNYAPGYQNYASIIGKGLVTVQGVDPQLSSVAKLTPFAFEESEGERNLSEGEETDLLVVLVVIVYFTDVHVGGVY